MNQTDEYLNPPDKMEFLRQQASSFGSGCGCHTPGASGKARRTQNMEPARRCLAGVLLVGAGFYLLGTF